MSVGFGYNLPLLFSKFISLYYLGFDHKDSAKKRLSEENTNIFAFLSVSFLSKSSTIQNKITFIFIAEVQPILNGVKDND